MTDADPAGTDWVPRLGSLQVPPQRAALIRSLFEFAAFVADHPELPLPTVNALMIPGGERFSEGMREVEATATALGVTPALAADGAYVASRRIGLVWVRCVVRPTPYGTDRDETLNAHASTGRLGHRTAADTAREYGAGGAR
ncbi:hypothetical protein EV652_10313 [Kribbella steppae]|uniref:Uncharacterized protein n=1 Tax=Kribbella steppae TaxID=2512223 RepID=A0A4R2HPC8_9ACTN|nr:hypothetical protein [Kribbella steppae]TCO33014.1 hypothetical protein EV652_10313 [Kribbella steppae]